MNTENSRMIEPDRFKLNLTGKSIASWNLSKKNQKQNCFQNKNNEIIRNPKKDIDKDKNGENVPKLESVEVVLVHCNLVKNDYHQTSKVLFTFVPNKEFGQLINISPHSLTMMNTVNTEFSFAEVWFTDQASKALEIEDNVNLMDAATKTGMDATKNASKRVVQKTAEATRDLIGSKIASKITLVGKPKEKTNKAEESYISPEKRQQIIDDIRLFWA